MHPHSSHPIYVLKTVSFKKNPVQPPQGKIRKRKWYSTNPTQGSTTKKIKDQQLVVCYMGGWSYIEGVYGILGRLWRYWSLDWPKITKKTRESEAGKTPKDLEHRWNQQQRQDSYRLCRIYKSGHLGPTVYQRENNHIWLDDKLDVRAETCTSTWTQDNHSAGGIFTGVLVPFGDKCLVSADQNETTTSPNAAVRQRMELSASHQHYQIRQSETINKLRSLPWTDKRHFERTHLSFTPPQHDWRRQFYPLLSTWRGVYQL